MKVDVKVQGRAEALDEGHCPGAGGVVSEASLPEQPGGNRAIDDAQGLAHQVRVAGKQEA